MTTKIMVGRKATGKDAIIVPDSCGMVGKTHAYVILDDEDGTVSIENIDAKNGTYVNGRAIVKSPLERGDDVWLGTIGPLGYNLNVDALIDGNRTDYSEEFSEVIKAYEEYYAECKRIEKIARNKTVMPRAIVSLLFAIISLVIFFIYQDISLRITVTTIGSALIAAINIIPFGKNDDVRIKMAELQLEYQDRYCCPKCGTKFNLNTHWKIVQRNHCPNPKCNAKFSKQ